MFKTDFIRDCGFEISSLNDCIQNLNKDITIPEFFDSAEIQNLLHSNVNLNKSDKILIYTIVDEPSRLAVNFKWNIYFNKNIKEPAIENILAQLNAKNIKIKESNLNITQRTIKIDFEIFNVMLEI